ncbi:hypothetical protein BGW36DRAFT_341872 [Talaromyces proteolyticus]|uniref:Protein phosphatase 4 core regulatory subunit R2 n=1 Tax=Talaromyces proteolyticus TaxID=1131652 RepID=A0AAD4KPY0_9EURO|nr:uncharacterized protein BGW36DRAFT_341872 [Talaromyces proteolyticus]KAH8697732.1 hypothetical protein BGW36DRAFT_341872 [Talaromyces proteolyticus]
MSLDEGLLEIVAQDGTMDYDRWPSQLEPLLERLDEIVRNEFPIPKVPPELASSFASQSSSFPSSYPVQDSLQSSNKENAPPPADQPLFSETQEVSEQQSSNQPSQTDADCLPPPLLSLLTSIKSTLRTYFVSNPPHTIQRLAELILRPTRQYRTLPAYLRAVDRVVSVSSSADIFPLPRTDVPGEGELSNGISNGITSSFMLADDSLGSDESLGGALLTPIPWLTNPHLEVAHADMVVEGAVPLRANAAVTQGELIRQEQEAGLVANSQASHSSVNALAEGEESGERLSPQPDEVPHARGPSVVGVEDLGLQDGKGVEMTISNSTPAQEDNNTEMDASSSLNPSNETPADETNESNGDADGDIVLDDISAKDNSAAPTRAEIEEDLMETNEQNEQKLPNAETSTAE